MKFTKPSFKVSVNKRHGAKLKPKISKKSLKRNYVSEGVNLYMSYSKQELIPKPPKAVMKILGSDHGKGLSKGLSKGIHKDQKSQTFLGSGKCTSKKKINPFIGFRSYYARIVKGRIRQQELSTILSQYWLSHHQVHKTWEFFTEHYNRDNTVMCFTEWLEKNYKPEIEGTAAVEISYGLPFIEDIYHEQAVKSTEWTPQELFGTKELHQEYQDILNKIIPIEDYSQLIDSLFCSIQKNDEGLYL
uniref:Mating type alpha1 protein n=1 Tax=Kluyveromyces waltii TaxID=4914 RepID=A6H5D7_KLUWA|nr:mating type alpha1 protein [Lachancea waltii]